MEFPTERKYSKEHTWISIQDNTGTIGITEFAQSELGEIVYADLPNVGYSFQQDEVFGSVEAVKTQCSQSLFQYGINIRPYMNLTSGGRQRII